jgi:hypothetical protein
LIALVCELLPEIHTTVYLDKSVEYKWKSSNRISSRGTKRRGLVLPKPQGEKMKQQK